MSKLLAIFTLGVAVVLAVSVAGATDIKTLRVGKQSNNNTRVVFEFTGKDTLAPKKLFTLHNPDRVVIDFPLVQFKQKTSDITLPPGVIVIGLRQGQFNATTLRLVLDLAQGVKTNTFSLKATKTQSPRLVVDLIPTQGRVKLAASVKRPKVEKNKTPAQSLILSSNNRPIVIENPTATPSLIATGKKKHSRTIIIIDPGHGGVDPGATGKRKTYEKDVVLAIALELKKIINDTPGYVAYTTRDHDIFIPLAQRVKTAQRRKGDLFVSIHADAHANREVRGGSVYVLSETASDKEAERLARVANEGDLVAGIDLSDEDDQVRDILIDLVQRETMNKSAVFARELINELNGVVKMKSTEPRFAGFRVLKSPEIPSALVEMSYISNPDDEAMLNNPNAQKKLAASVARGIFNYSRQYLNAE